MRHLYNKEKQQRMKPELGVSYRGRAENGPQASPSCLSPWLGSSLKCRFPGPAEPS